MPKTASQTVEATLRQSGLRQEIIRTHSLSRHQAAELRKRIQSDDVPPAWKQKAVNQLRARSRLLFALRSRRLLVACGARLAPLKVLASVRDVIGAGLSSVFENYALYASAPELLSVEKCRELLCRPRPCGYYREWFDRELKPHLGIDVYETVFPVQQKYRIYESAFARVLLYRFDLLPQLPALLQEFLGVRIQKLVDKNLTSAKPHAQAYTLVKAQLRLPGQFVREQLSCKFMRHFYSAEERARLYAQWSGEQPDTFPGRGAELAEASATAGRPAGPPCA